MKKSIKRVDFRGRDVSLIFRNLLHDDSKSNDHVKCTRNADGVLCLISGGNQDRCDKDMAILNEILLLHNQFNPPALLVHLSNNSEEDNLLLDGGVSTGREDLCKLVGSVASVGSKVLYTSMLELVV